MKNHFLINEDTMEGKVRAYLINPNGQRVKVFHKKNTILANAKTILCHLLGGGGQLIDYITAYRSSSILFSAPVTTYTYPTSNSIQISALFTSTSFSGVLDELRLTSSIGGDFSQLVSLNINKPTGYQLEIIWTITFVDCIPNTNYMNIEFITTAGQTTYVNSSLIGATIITHFYDTRRLDDASSPHPEFTFDNTTGTITYNTTEFPSGLTGGIQCSIIFST